MCLIPTFLHPCICISLLHRSPKTKSWCPTVLWECSASTMTSVSLCLVKAQCWTLPRSILINHDPYNPSSLECFTSSSKEMCHYSTTPIQHYSSNNSSNRLFVDILVKTNLLNKSYGQIYRTCRNVWKWAAGRWALVSYKSSSLWKTKKDLNGKSQVFYQGTQASTPLHSAQVGHLNNCFHYKAVVHFSTPRIALCDEWARRCSVC